MYRLSESLAKEILLKIKDPEIISTGNDAFTFKSRNSIGIVDPHAAIGSDFHYSIECPSPIILPDIPYVPNGVDGYYLYKREELLVPVSPWEVAKVLIDPSCTDYESKIDVAECSIVLPSNVDKLVAKTITTMEQLIKLEPTIIDCLELKK